MRDDLELDYPGDYDHVSQSPGCHGDTVAIVQSNHNNCTKHTVTVKSKSYQTDQLSIISKRDQMITS